jgi:hypothetical protein
MRFRTASLLLVLIPLSLHERSVKIQVLKPGLARRQILLPALRAGDDVAGTASLLTPNITVGPVLLKLHVSLFRTCCDGPRFAEGQSPKQVIVSRLAGTCNRETYGKLDGKPANARFDLPSGVALLGTRGPVVLV